MQLLAIPARWRLMVLKRLETFKGEHVCQAIAILLRHSFVLAPHQSIDSMKVDRFDQVEDLRVVDDLHQYVFRPLKLASCLKVNAFENVT